jgi:hypothetical protein
MARRREVIQTMVYTATILRYTKYTLVGWLGESKGQLNKTSHEDLPLAKMNADMDS